jgi:4-coumarate--CoA ligase
VVNSRFNPYHLQHVSDAKVSYKHLAGGIHFVDAVPKSPSGKLLRRLLRDEAKVLKEKILAEEPKAKAKL